MGHDISAWAGEAYDSKEIAYNRRVALNPLNQVLYLALGVMDEAYCGCSGCGVQLEITKEQIITALEVIKTKDFVGMARERNPADELVDILSGDDAFSVIRTDFNTESVSQEVQFLCDCYAYLLGSGKDRLTISFG